MLISGVNESPQNNTRSSLRLLVNYSNSIYIKFCSERFYVFLYNINVWRKSSWQFSSYKHLLIFTQLRITHAPRSSPKTHMHNFKHTATMGFSFREIHPIVFRGDPATKFWHVSCLYSGHPRKFLPRRRDLEKFQALPLI